MRLRDKVAVITGGSSGIGRAIAKLFAQQGAISCVFDIREDSRLSDEGGSVTELLNSVGSGKFYNVDLTDKNQVEAGIAEVISDFGKVDILVNNAGIFVRNEITDVSDDELEKVYDINLKSYFYILRPVISDMLKRQHGKIVNISSIHGFFGTGGSATYCATKGAIINLTKQLAVDYSKRGIYANCISPGTIVTAMSKPFRETPNLLEEYHRRTMLPELGTPEDVAFGALYLASDESNYVQGHNLVIDGGWTSW